MASRMITRTISSVLLTIKAYNSQTEETVETTMAMPQNIKPSNWKKAIQRRFDEDDSGLVFIKVIDEEHVEHRYAMDEEFFIANAKIIDNE